MSVNEGFDGNDNKTSLKGSPAADELNACIQPTVRVHLIISSIIKRVWYDTSFECRCWRVHVSQQIMHVS